MPATTKGAWRLQEVRDALLKGEWVTYSNLADAGEYWAWGGNNVGQLGDSSNTPRSSPVQIPGTSWICVGVGLGLKSDNTLWTWGYNTGTNICQWISCNSPVQIPGTSWTNIGFNNASEIKHAMKSDGTLWGWGGLSTPTASGWASTLGVSTNVAVSSPVQIPGTQWLELTSATSLALARKADGTLWVWGVYDAGYFGQNGAFVIGGSPSQIPGTNWSTLSKHNLGSLVLAQKNNGTLWAWGCNNCFQLSTLVPTALPGLSSPIQIASGGFCHYHFASMSCNFALIPQGTTYPNTICMYGADTSAIPGVFSSCFYTGCWSELATYTTGVLATKTDGTLWSWGIDGGTGIIGNNTYNQIYSSPVQIPGSCWVRPAKGGRAQKLV